MEMLERFGRHDNSLCKRCHRLFGDRSFERLGSTSYSARDPVLHKSIHSLKKSVKQGCKICVCLPVDELELGRGRTYFQLSKLDSGYYLTFHDNEYGHRTAATLAIESVQSKASRRLHDAARNARSAPNTGDVRISQLIFQWLQDCLEHHKDCSHNLQPKQYPTRLLDVSADTIRLVNTSEEHIAQPYATVSYCWGETLFNVLTSDNIEEFRRGIPMDTFPLTLRHLIITARRLGLKYIWIDSYCIIQRGDTASLDKQQEISRMSQVYANATINIAASCAKDTSSGCFVQRSGVREPFEVLWKPEESSEKITYSVQSKATDQLVKTGPLLKRAWVLQELVLAPRVVYFDRGQVSWSCDTTCTATEMFPSGEPEFYYDRTIYPYTRFSTLWTRQMTPSVDETWKFWRSMIKEYSRMGLSYATDDKFAAIGALASKVASLLDDEYVAGHFRKTLVFELLWRPAGKKRKAIQWRAPSWSWACMDSPIEPAFKVTALTESAFNRPMIDIHRVFVDLVNSENPYGGIRSASLDVQGKLLEVDCDERGSVFLDGVSIAHLFSDDFDDEILFGHRLAFLLLEVDDSPSREAYTYLVLQHVQAKVFQRVGIAMVSLLEEEMEDVGLYAKIMQQDDRIISLV